ncbi:alpha-1,2-mannosidase from Trichoderma Reesei [Sodiomyces alkalinus F11]|uniref:alpha-1,2-Mannosidase n=1 Tax=Sodiomyces alkalinus (strain CBS 110278 / VKM F-3762 / F11) TaxID=1314773 RepID=A0A3N2PVB7_SODAK|nr:alpha-1,2-mannosidase from Trichoderma Reesei [Sodiomyces alkalinus F11]ROT38442.1 alpha-1,2-mannosidase from Trichoderma Reesei [Sodiomyces alkalinus F11]
MRLRYHPYSPLILFGLAAARSLADSTASTLDGADTTHTHRKGGPDAAKARAVKDAYLISWNGYYDHAFPDDTLQPVTNGSVNDRSSWGVTAVDSLSAAIIFQDAESVNQILEFIPTIDFTTTRRSEFFSLFETNIRYVGGLLSAYDLLSLPQYRNLPENKTHVETLLKQAVSLGNALKFAFDTPSGVPDPSIQLNPAPRRSGALTNNIAEAGTLVLEWTRLSDLTGDPSYAALAQKAESYILHPAPPSAEPFPGLVGTHLRIADGRFTDTSGGWSGLTDSFYEYLIKMYLYDPDQFAFYKERWMAAADSTMRYLVSHPSTRQDITFLSLYRGTTTIPVSTHLASFAGGNFILGGLLLNETKYVDFGLRLAESYYQTYRGTATGIGPEAFRWFDNAKPPSGDNTPPPTAEDAASYASAGFWATARQYILRPETVESLYHAYRATGDAKYQDMAWRAFRDVARAARVGGAYAGLADVTGADGGRFLDRMESFWITETLKYLYLLFTEDSEIQVQAGRPNMWVYGTEAQPYRIRSNR